MAAPAYSIDVTDTGPYPARNVVLHDVLPSLLRVTALPAGCARRGTAISCTIKLLRVGRTWGIRFTVNVSYRAAPGARIRNCVSATSIPTTLLGARRSCTTALVVQGPSVPVTG